MRLLKVPFGTTLLLWAIGSFAALNAQDSLSPDAIPDSASVVVRWKTPQATVGKLADFVDVVQPGFGGIVRPGLPAIGDAMGIPGLNGVDVERDFWAIIFAESQETPSIVFVITATDVDAVKKALASGFEVHTSGKLVIYSQDEEAVAKIRQRMSGDGKSLYTQIDAASKSLFDAADVSALVNIKQLATEFSAELDQAELQLDALIEQVTNNVPEEQRTQLEAAMDIYRQLGKWALLGVRDSNSLASGITFTKSAIRYEDRLQVAEASATAKFLAAQPPAELTLINRLPGNKSGYLGAKFDMSGILESSMKLTKKLLMSDATDAQSAEYDAAVKDMAKLKYDEMAIYFDLDGKSPALRTGGATVVTPTNTLRDITRTLMKSMSEVHAPGLSQKTKLDPSAEKIAGTEIDLVTMSQEFDEKGDPFGIQKKIQAVLFGDSGMVYRYAYQPNRVLQTLGGGTAEMQSLLTAIDSKSSEKTTVASARQRHLGKLGKANLIALVDPSRLGVSILKLVSEQNVFPVNVTELDKLKLESSFIGYGLALEPNHVRTQWEIPAEQVQNIVKLVFFVQSQR